MEQIKAIIGKITKLGPGVKGAATVLGLIGGLLGLKQYRDGHPSIDLSGQWLAHITVQRSEFKAYEGLELTFHVYLRQEGNKVTGSGEKWSENGKELPPAARSQVIFQGTFDGDELHLNYTETGTKRTTMGQYELHVIDDGATCEGVIAGTAANSTGTTVWERRAQF